MAGAHNVRGRTVRNEASRVGRGQIWWVLKAILGSLYLNSSKGNALKDF